VRNIKLTIQYDGALFSGFELQPHKKTVRGEIEKALSKLFKTPIKIISASRTDSGVHALGLVVGFKLAHPIPTRKIVAALNSCLPEGVRAIEAQEKRQKFHARYDTKGKEYEYLIYNGQILPPFARNFVWQVKPKLDLASMKKAAKFLVGKHDFSSFCAARSDDKDRVRTLYKISLSKHKIRVWDGNQVEVISCKVAGNGFLYKMVRNIVGTLVDVGLKKIKAAEVEKILEACDRRSAGRTAPPQGLCLVKVNY